MSVLYQNLFTRDHFLAGGGRIDRGHIQSNNLLVDVTYGLTDKMALDAGGAVHPYAVLGPCLRTPRLEDLTGPTRTAGFRTCGSGSATTSSTAPPSPSRPLSVPTCPRHSYEYFAHAALGTRVRELEVGSVLRPHAGPRPSRTTFVQAQVCVQLCEAHRGHPPRPQQSRPRSRLHPHACRCESSRSRAGQTTLGGIDTPDAGWRAMPANLAEHHDRIARLEMLDFGGGVQISVSQVNRGVRRVLTTPRSTTPRAAQGTPGWLLVGLVLYSRPGWCEPAGGPPPHASAFRGEPVNSETAKKFDRTIEG